MLQQNEINNIRFPLINIRRTSNLAVAPINTFSLAIGLFMIAAPLMEWCEFKSPTLGVALACGGICQYIIGIYNWYQNETILSFIDFSFSFLFFLICYVIYYATQSMQTLVIGQIVIKSEMFESYMMGTFFLLYLVCLLALAFACLNSKNKGLIHLIYLGLIVIADVFIIVWEYRSKNNKPNILKRLRKVAGYFLFVASIALWYSGVGRFINEIFQKNMIPLVESPNA